jgi:hypothetical protein
MHTSSLSHNHFTAAHSAVLAGSTQHNPQPLLAHGYLKVHIIVPESAGQIDTVLDDSSFFDISRECSGSDHRVPDVTRVVCASSQSEESGRLQEGVGSNHMTAITSACDNMISFIRHSKALRCLLHICPGEMKEAIIFSLRIFQI